MECEICKKEMSYSKEINKKVIKLYMKGNSGRALDLMQIQAIKMHTILVKILISRTKVKHTP